MSPEVQVVLSSALTFGVPLAFAARELAALRRRPRNSGGPDDRGGNTPPPTRPRDLSPEHKPLPACLIPVRIATPPTRERILERV